MKPANSLGEIISALADVPAQHARNSRIYSLLEKVARQALSESRLAFTEGARERLGGFGEIELPYHKMGAVDSLDLFGLDELIIFAFYWANRNRYRRAADIGANLGLHSILMSRCGWSVTAYEPDPRHAALLRRNLDVNCCSAVSLVEAAVSVNSGAMEFIRVIGNTTSSHLAGAKPNPYGELERFPVCVESIETIMPSVDFIKMDAEGQEKLIILGTQAAHWQNTDMIVEIGSPENAAAIYEHLDRFRINAFAQKLGWAMVNRVEDMPVSYKEGSLFITSKPRMSWCEEGNP
jgi:FkbM family methyltransferase